MTTYQLPRLRLGHLSDAAVSKCVCTLGYIPEVFPTSIRRKCVQVATRDVATYMRSSLLQDSYPAIFSTRIVAADYFWKTVKNSEAEKQKIVAVTNLMPNYLPRENREFYHCSIIPRILLVFRFCGC